MTILTIRSSIRYAVRQSLRVEIVDGRTAQGLLIELSQRGCRISNLGGIQVAIGDAVVLELGDKMLRAFVRWSCFGVIGVRFEEALFPKHLADLLLHSRSKPNVSGAGADNKRENYSRAVMR